jgi:hypothetical protein
MIIVRRFMFNTNKRSWTKRELVDVLMQTYDRFTQPDLYETVEVFLNKLSSTPESTKGPECTCINHGKQKNGKYLVDNRECERHGGRCGICGELGVHVDCKSSPTVPQPTDGLTDNAPVQKEEIVDESSPTEVPCPHKNKKHFTDNNKSPIWCFDCNTEVTHTTLPEELTDEDFAEDSILSEGLSIVGYNYRLTEKGKNKLIRLLNFISKSEDRV